MCKWFIKEMFPEKPGSWGWQTEKGKNPRKGPSQAKSPSQPDPPRGARGRGVNYTSGCVPTPRQGGWAFRLPHQQLTLPVYGPPWRKRELPALSGPLHLWPFRSQGTQKPWARWTTHRYGERMRGIWHGLQQYQSHHRSLQNAGFLGLSFGED